MYKYRELYVQQHNPPDLARRIKEMSGEEQYVATLADPSVWAKDQYGKEIHAQGETVAY